MQKWEIDVSVLIIFFIRNEQLKHTFEAVKNVRPRKLLLWQDGPRDKNDIKRMLECRKIVSDIDWECEVYRFYNEKNYGCDPSTYYSHKWAFSITEKCIILEDDHVANKSFFYFCKELLDLYENDERINHICGMNAMGDYSGCSSDYFFTYTGSNAWASWKRVIAGWDESYQFMNNKRDLYNLKKIHGSRFDAWHRVARRHAKTKVPYWESIMCFDCALNSRLVIMPKKNMVKNIGFTEDSTHSNAQMKCLTKTEQRILNPRVYECEFPLNHPKNVVPDIMYMKKVDWLWGNGHPFIKLYRKIYHIVSYLIYGEMIYRVRKRIMGR